MTAPSLPSLDDNDIGTGTDRLDMLLKIARGIVLGKTTQEMIRELGVSWRVITKLRRRFFSGKNSRELRKTVDNLIERRRLLLAAIKAVKRIEKREV